MSVMHILGAIFIGIVVGRLFATFTLRKIKGGKYTFMVVGIIGALLGDIVFRILYEHDLVSKFFLEQITIVFEMIGGALVACYILNVFGKKQMITFE